MKPQDYNAEETGGSKLGPPVSVLGDAPSELQLRLEPGQSHQLILRMVEVCDVQWDISQVESGSRRLAAGETQTIPLTVPRTAPLCSLIRGQVVIRRPDDTPLRTIPVTGWVRKPQAARRPKQEKRSFWVKLLLWLLPVCVVAAVAWYCVQPPHW